MSSVSILISSFDGFEDCWDAVCHGFNKYWPDCPYPIYLMTNTKDHPDPRIQVLKVSGGKDWSPRMIDAVEKLQTEYVMYFQEDYWIEGAECHDGLGKTVTSLTNGFPRLFHGPD